MLHIVVTLILLKGQIVNYILPKEYDQRWQCDAAIEQFKEDWKTKKGIGVVYRCGFVMHI